MSASTSDAGVFDSLRTRVRSIPHHRERLLAAVIALLAGIVVYTIASEVFPYHSSNHDEAVYLQQAELLLSGQFQYRPGPFGEAVRPWFFVDSGATQYPKYQPLPAGFYAVGIALFGEPRVVLAAVAAGNTALVYVLGSMLFDRRVGVLAAAGFALSPMALVNSAVFLPYAPTALFNLAFAVLYLRARRSRRPATGALAGVAIGIAFFMRPFTAVLFGTPFILHALWEVVTALRGLERWPGVAELPRPLFQLGATALAGLVFVALALAYNAYITGSPFVFPYEAFAPKDGPGFGRRRILAHSIEYTPEVALRANAHVLWYLSTRWVTAGPLGTVLAGFGMVAAAGSWQLLESDGTGRRWDLLDGDETGQRLLAGLFLTVPAGNLFFWGNYNVLADMSDPTDGLLGQFGPFYHFDLLAPVAIFAAAGAVVLWRGTCRVLERRETPAFTVRQRRALGVAVLIAGSLVVGGANAALVSAPIDRNQAHTETYEDAYEPLEDHEFENALVFMPTPYGEWLSHPFQYLRNEPGFDGDVVYVMDREPASDFAMVQAAPDRQLYRYTYQGEWTPDPTDREVAPRLEQLSVRSGDRLEGETVVGVPARVENARVRIETGHGYAAYDLSEPGEEISVTWSLDGDTLTLETVDGRSVTNGTAENRTEATGVPRLSGEEGGSVRLDDVDEAVVMVRLVQSEGSTLTYRQVVSVRDTGDEVEVLWPPERTVCPLVDACDREGTYLPDQPDQHRDGVRFETELNTTQS